MGRSNYSLSVIGNLIFLIDMNTGMTITNNVENVVKEVRQSINKPLDGFVIIYEDTNGDIDEIQVREDAFYGFKHLGATDLEDAKLKLGNRVKL